MTVWWCDAHASGFNATDEPSHCHAWSGGLLPSVIETDDWVARPAPCRMVQMELKPIGPTPASYDIEIPDFVNRVAPEEVNRFGVW